MNTNKSTQKTAAKHPWGWTLTLYAGIVVLLVFTYTYSGVEIERVPAYPEVVEKKTTKEIPLGDRAKNGDADAQYTLGRQYMEKRHRPEKSHAKGIELLTRAAVQGHSAAQLTLAGIYATGSINFTGLPWGPHKDGAKAKHWYMRAAQQGNRHGQFALGMINMYGIYGVQRSDHEALKWYLLAAKQGHANAQYQVARFYKEARGGLSRSDIEAFNWYKLAAEQGHKRALEALGWLNTDNHARIIKQ